MKRTPEEQAEVYKSLYKTFKLIDEINALEAKADLTPWIEEGKRIGKVPWCAGGIIHQRLIGYFAGMDIFEQETMEETVARRKKENDKV